MQSVVNFISDGLGLTPSEYAQVLLECTANGSVRTDSYALGGAVEEVEGKFAHAPPDWRQWCFAHGPLSSTRPIGIFGVRSTDDISS